MHSTSALDAYGAILQRLGCICRALIAIGEKTCCDVRDAHALEGKAFSAARGSTTSSRSSTSISSARAVRGAAVRQRKGKGLSVAVTNNIQANKSACDKSDRSGGCCPKPTAAAEMTRFAKPASRPAEGIAKGCSGDSCCSPAVEKCPPAEPSKGSCCGTKKATNAVDDGACGGKQTSKPTCSEPRGPIDETDQEFTCADACCEKKQATEVKTSYADTCCDGDPTASENGSCVDACCEEQPTNAKGSCADACCEQEPVLAKESCADSCCDEEQPADVKGPCADACCGDTDPASDEEACADACCSTGPIASSEATPAADSGTADVENGSTGKEHVILSISGMTCTGCETKLSRTLATLPAVRDLKTSLVLARAEFNLDLRLGSADDVIKHLERTTEFKCERVQGQGSFSIDFLVPDDASVFENQPWPAGVIDVQAVGKDTQRVRAAFDPKIVGARDLAEKGWDRPMMLAPLQGDASLEAGSKHVRHMGWMTLLSAGLTIPVLVMEWAPLPEREVAYSSASLALATVVQVVIAGPFYPKAIKALVFSRIIEMDLLIVLSTSAAYVFSVVSFGFLIAKQPLSTGQFFETSTLLVTLIMVGRWVAALSRQRAVESISIRSLQAPTAVIVDVGAERVIDARLLQYGDVFKVLPDIRVPTDGTVLSGSSEVDESMLTGESRPVEKHPKSAVIAGSINGSGVLTVRLNRLPGDNTISTIAAMVDEAKLSKPRLQDLADQVASYFVPVVVMLTIITFVIWVAVGLKIRNQSGSEATIQAITYAITVLIVSCPCAIGLAVPMVVVIASGVAAEKGIIFKSAEAIEVAHKTSHVVFDKTGTLTRGQLSVVSTQHQSQDKLGLLLGLVESSRHPVSVAVASHLKAMEIMARSVPDPKSIAGRGMESVSKGQTLQAGNSRWLGVSSHDLVQPMLAKGYTVFCFVVDGQLEAVFGLEDELRSDAATTIESLQKRGVSVHIVSGDDDGAVQSCPSKLGVLPANVRSRASPADKQDYIATLLGKDSKKQTKGKKQVVVFCGDGTNDAVALARATIGVHMNEGTDVAQSAADVVLMRPLLQGVVTMIEASRLSVNRIRFNFAWSFVYNTFAVLLAAGAFVNARIPPEYAGLGELVSVLPVIAAAVLLRWAKF